MSKKIDIVVNTYPRVGREEDLMRCLDSLEKQSYKNFLIILVENSGSDDEASKIVDKYKERMEIRLVCCPIKRLPALFNIGFRSGVNKILAFLADDTAADKKWLENIVVELDGNKKIAAVSGPVISSSFPTGEMHSLYLKMNSNWFWRILVWPYIFFAMENSPSSPGKYFDSGAYSFGTALPESIHFERQEIDLLTTTSMGIKRKVLEQMNGFNNDFCFNHADGDLFLRIKEAGYKLIFSPKIRVKHMVRIGPSRNAYFIGRDTGVFHRKHLKPKSIRSLIGAVLNILVLNGYWLFSTISRRDISQLKGVTGYIEGLLR